jgi:predicted nucleotidyltransferase
MPPASRRQRATREFVDRLRRNLRRHIVDVRLFGSEARGDAAPESDIDVFVIVQPDHDRPVLETRVVDIAFDVNLEFGVFISPTVASPGEVTHPMLRETPFIETVMREGIPL